MTIFTSCTSSSIGDKKDPNSEGLGFGGMLPTRSKVCMQSFGTIGLGEFNCPLNYSCCTCGKFIAKGLCTLGLVRANVSDNHS